MKDKIQFSLILCCFNEEENLEKTVDISIPVLNTLFKRFEIIIIDDASLDHTLHIANRLAEKYKDIRVIKNRINLGQGISFLIGLKEAGGELMMQNGADRCFDIEDLKKVLPLFPENDIAVISRIDRSSYSLWRKLTSWINIILRWLLFDREFKDLNFVQVYKKKVTDTIQVNSRSAAFVTQELVLKAKQKGFKISEVKFPNYKRVAGQEHHGKPKDIIWTLGDMINFLFECRKR